MVLSKKVMYRCLFVAWLILIGQLILSLDYYNLCHLHFVQVAQVNTWYNSTESYDINSDSLLNLTKNVNVTSYSRDGQVVVDFNNLIYDPKQMGNAIGSSLEIFSSYNGTCSGVDHRECKLCQLKWIILVIMISEAIILVIFQIGFYIYFKNVEMEECEEDIEMSLLQDLSNRF